MQLVICYIKPFLREIEGLVDEVGVLCFHLFGQSGLVTWRVGGQK